jgi:hypothetical protein
MRVIMLAIIDEAGRKFNADKLDGLGRRDRVKQRAANGANGTTRLR